MILYPSKNNFPWDDKFDFFKFQGILENMVESADGRKSERTQVERGGKVYEGIVKEFSCSKCGTLIGKVFLPDDGASWVIEGERAFSALSGSGFVHERCIPK